MRISKIAASLILGGLVFVAGGGALQACEDDWLQVKQALGPADQTRARLLRDMRAGFDDVPLGQTLSTIQSRSGVVFSVHWEELKAYGLTKTSPMRLMPWRVASVNKTLHDILGGKIKDRPVLSIDADGKVRIPGARPKVLPEVVAEGGVVVPSPVLEATTKPWSWVGEGGLAESMPDSDPGIGIALDGGMVAGPDEGDALIPKEGAPAAEPAAKVTPSPAAATGVEPVAGVTPSPAKATVAEPSGDAEKAPATQPEAKTPKGEVSNTGKFVEIVPFAEAKTTVSENDRLIAELTRRGVRFNPVYEGTGLVAKIAPGVLSDEILADVARVKGVAELIVSDCSAGMQVSGTGMKSIGSMTELTGLALRQSGVDSEGFKEIGKLTRLKWLELGQVKMTSANMAVVAGLPRLEKLWMHGMMLASKDIEPLAKGGTIKEMRVSAHMSMDDWTFTFETLAKMGALEELELPSMNLNTLEQGLKKLRIKRITLEDRRTTDEHLEVLSEFPLLEGVTLKNPTGVSRKGYALLAKLPKLTYFKASGLVDESPLSPIGQIKTLEEVDLSGLQASETTLNWVGGLTNLKRLSLYNGRFGDEDLLKLKGLTKLQSLMLSGNHNLTDKGMAVLDGMTSLEKLFVCGTKISDASLPRLLNLRKLVRLDICHTQITDAGAGQLEGMAKLEELTLGGKNTDAVLSSLARVKALKLLEIRGSKLTPAGLNGLRAKSQGLRIKSWE